MPRPTRNPTLRPTPRGCVPSYQIYRETFEDGLLLGWRNGRLESAPHFTKFLGRYGRINSGPGKDPFKTYEGIPRNAQSVVLEFNFYEIDSWDAAQRDYVCVAIDGRQIDLGRFDLNQNENGRTGSRHGMTFRIRSQAAPRNIGFNSRWKDQIHHVTVTIPRSYYQSDGRIQVMFQVRLDESDINNESAGFDNIKITAKFNCNGGCVPSRVVYNTETFENGRSDGWRNGRIESAPTFTKFLGRYGRLNSGPGKDPVKTYSNFPRDAAHVVLEFDFYEIDSWDASHRDYVCVAIDGKQIDLGRFDLNANENGRRGSRHGMSFLIQSRTTPRNIGFNSRWKDQIHHIIVTIPRSYYQHDGRLTLMFQVRLNESDINNESAGFDNIKFTAKFNCRRRLEAGVHDDEPNVLALDSLASTDSTDIISLPNLDNAENMMDGDLPIDRDALPVGLGEGETSLKVDEMQNKHSAPEETQDSAIASVTLQDTVTSGCEMASRAVDIDEIPMEKCTVSAETHAISITSQDVDSVSFAVSQLWKGCTESNEGVSVSWLATDFVGADGELHCAKAEEAPCGVVNTYTAQCEDGVSIVDLYAYDSDGTLFQSEEEKVFVPLACGSTGDLKKMCHFRYLLKCAPSLCDTTNSPEKDVVIGGSAESRKLRG